MDMEADPTARAILEEAQGAHRKTHQILALLLEEDEGEGGQDPVQSILRLLINAQATQQGILRTQETILTRLSIIERLVKTQAGPRGTTPVESQGG